MRIIETIVISAVLALFAALPAHSSGAGVEPLVKELLRETKVLPWDSGVAPQLGFDTEVVPVVAFRVIRSTLSTVDRQFFVILESSSVLKPASLVVTRSENPDTPNERIWFYKTDPQGVLLRAVTVDYTATTEPEISSPATKKHFNVEWNFWKDMAKRKKTKPSRSKK